MWDEVESDSGNCLGRQCPTYNDCFYYRARRRVQNAQILVVNHALFFSDLALRRSGASILPDYDVVIFDEAHTLEAVAGDHLGVNVSSGQIEYVLNKLYNDRTNRGLLVHHQLAEAQQEVQTCRYRADEFFDAIADWLAERRQGTRPRRRAGDRRQPAQPGAGASWPARCKARRDASARGRAARFHRGRRSAAGAGRRGSRTGAASSQPTRCIGSTRRAAAAAGRG